LQRKQPQHINVSAVRAGKNGLAKQKQQKRLNASQPNLTPLLIFLLCLRLNQLITPIEELFVAPL